MKHPGRHAQTTARPHLSVTGRSKRIPLVIAAYRAVLLAGCHHSGTLVSTPKPVVALTLHPDGNAVANTLPGQVQTRYSTSLSLRVAGKVIERRVHIGDTVKQGQVLAILDRSGLRNDLANARAQLEAAEHRLVYAKQQLDRDRAQSQVNLVAPAQMEQMQDAYASTFAQHDSTHAQAALVGDRLRYAALVADHDDVIILEDADTGQNVQAGQSIYHLDWMGDVDIVCDASENALSPLTVGSTARISLPATPSQVSEARAREVSPTADPQSRTWRVKLSLVAPGAAVRVGMTANIAFDAKSDAGAARPSKLPVTALSHRGGEPAVWVVRANTDTLELCPVTIAHYDERSVLVASGLRDGGRVVMQGVRAVNAGQHVQVVAPLHPEDFAS